MVCQRVACAVVSANMLMDISPRPTLSSFLSSYDKTHTSKHLPLIKVVHMLSGHINYAHHCPVSAVICHDMWCTSLDHKTRETKA